MIVTVFLSKAIICFSGLCYPALIGNNTSVGTYNLQPRMVLADGYDGSVLQYKEDTSTIYAIHKVWTEIPSENRMKRLQSDEVSDRIGVTKGCINVSSEVYNMLIDCCSNSILEIRE